jgi:Zn-dependent M32 family carboxypeptidase
MKYMSVISVMKILQVHITYVQVDISEMHFISSSPAYDVRVTSILSA